VPIVVNSNASATSASFNLSRANDGLQKSLTKLSSGNRINNPADDAVGLAVAYKLNAKGNQTSVILQNTQNAVSYLQVQDDSLQPAGKIVDRISELKVMSLGINKNSQVLENHSKEFIELQSQLNQVSKVNFNGISLFASSFANSIDGVVNHFDPTEPNSEKYGEITDDTFSSTAHTHDSGARTEGFVLVNVVNFQFMFSMHSTISGGTGFDLENVHAGNPSNTALTAGGYISDIAEINVSQFTDIIERIANMRAGNGAEQNRLSMTMDLLRSNLSNIESAHGRIMNTDIAIESTRFERQNVLDLASASMTAQANQNYKCGPTIIGLKTVTKNFYPITGCEQQITINQGR
jgi:flagellin